MLQRKIHLSALAGREFDLPCRRRIRSIGPVHDGPVSHLWFIGTLCADAIGIAIGHHGNVISARRETRDAELAILVGAAAATWLLLFTSVDDDTGLDLYLCAFHGPTVGINHLSEDDRFRDELHYDGIGVRSNLDRPVTEPARTDFVFVEEPGFAHVEHEHAGVHTLKMKAAIAGGEN